MGVFFVCYFVCVSQKERERERAFESVRHVRTQRVGPGIITGSIVRITGYVFYCALQLDTVCDWLNEIKKMLSCQHNFSFRQTKFS